jgi:hypothetical protein
MGKVTVVTPSVRSEGLDLVKKALDRQTLDDFEWVIVSPFKPSQPCRWVPEPQKNTGDYWTLNKAMNSAIRVAEGDLIVSWQDYTYAQADALEKFLGWYEAEPMALVSGVGNKYTNNLWQEKIWQDPRERDDLGSSYPCIFADIEWNFCSVPKAALESVGGFDESLDQYAGMDGYSVVDRLNMLGTYSFRLDQTNKSYSLHHGRLPEWDQKNAIGPVYGKKHDEYVKNPVLKYL